MKETSLTLAIEFVSWRCPREATAAVHRKVAARWKRRRDEILRTHDQGRRRWWWWCVRARLVRPPWCDRWVRCERVSLTFTWCEEEEDRKTCYDFEWSEAITGTREGKQMLRLEHTRYMHLSLSGSCEIDPCLSPSHVKICRRSTKLNTQRERGSKAIYLHAKAGQTLQDMWKVRMTALTTLSVSVGPLDVIY